MKFCGNCGNQISGSDMFCSACGTKVNQGQQEDTLSTAEENPVNQQPTSPATSPIPPVQNPDSEVKPKRRSMKAWIIPLSLIAGLILIGLSGYLYLANKTNPDAVIRQFEQAVVDEDIPLLLTMLESGHEDIELDEESVKQFVQFLQDDSAAMDDVMNYLFIQRDSGRTQSEAVLTIHTSGKQYLFFDRYVFQIKPYYMDLVSNQAHTDFYIGDDKIATATEAFEPVTAGPFLPGKYEIRAEYQGDYVVLEQNITETLFYLPTQYINFELEGDYVYLYDYGDTDMNIILNGEDTGIKVNDLEYGEFGPLIFDGSTTIAIEHSYPWGKERSEEITLAEEHKDTVITDLFEENKNEQTREDIMTVINNYTLGLVNALTEQNADLIKHISEEEKESIAAEIEFVEISGVDLTARLNSMIYNLDSFYLSHYNGVYTADIDVKTSMTFTYQIPGEDPYVEDQVMSFSYTLTYDPSYGDWMITSEWEIYNFHATNIQEYNF